MAALPYCIILPWSHCSVSGICRSPAPPGFICSFMGFQRAWSPVALAAPVAPEAPNVSKLPAPSPAFGEDRCLKRSSRMLHCFLRGSMMQKTLRGAKGNCVVSFLFFFMVGLPDSRPFPRFQSFQSRFATISLATLPIYNIWQGQMSTLQSQAVCSLVSSHSGKLYGPASKTCCHLHTKTSGFNADRFAHPRWSRSLPFLWQGLLLSVQLQTERWCS